MLKSKERVKSMAVFRIERTHDYTVMSNHHQRNHELSLKAKGLLSMMLSLSEDWNYTTRGLAKICKEGVDTIGGALREPAAKIAALTEDLKGLRSAKDLLLASLAYTEEDAAAKFPKDIAAMEKSLKRLKQPEQKYSAELDAALTEYAGLLEQAQGFDPVQLYEARQTIRPGKEQEAENRVQEVYGEQYSTLLIFDSKKTVSRMLNEDIEQQPVRRMVRQAQKEQQTFHNEKAKNGDSRSR